MKLQMTRKTDLALRVLRHLDGAAARQRTAEIADKVGTTASFLPQVMTALVRAGWVESRPGPTGGYQLGTDPSVISVLDVIEAVEGPIDPRRCVLRGTPCLQLEPCSVHEAWLVAREALHAALGRTPVATIAAAGGTTVPHIESIQEVTGQW